MSDPWQEDTDAEDDWEEELSDPVEGSLFEEGELAGDDDDPDLWDDTSDDEA